MWPRHILSVPTVRLLIKRNPSRDVIILSCLTGRDQAHIKLSEVHQRCQHQSVAVMSQTLRWRHTVKWKSCDLCDGSASEGVSNQHQNQWCTRKLCIKSTVCISWEFLLSLSFYWIQIITASPYSAVHSPQQSVLLLQVLPYVQCRWCDINYATLKSLCSLFCGEAWGETLVPVGLNNMKIHLSP